MTYPAIPTTLLGGAASNSDGAAGVSVPANAAGAIGTGQAAAHTFIPIAWANEMLVQREVEMVFTNRCRRINFVGKKGDTLRIPFVSDLTCQDFTAGIAVVPQVNPEGLKDMVIDRHKVVAVQHDDVFTMQSQYDLRAAFNKKMGYALAKDLEVAAMEGLAAALAAAYKVVAADGVTQYVAGNAADITDAGLRRMIRRLKDNLVPQNMEDWSLILPPSQEEVMLGIDKFTLFQNIGSTDPVRKGLLGRYYGINTYVTPLCPTVNVTERIGFLMHRDAFAVGVQMNPRFQTQYKLELLGNLMVADTVSGLKGLRVDADNVSASNNRISHAIAFYCK